MFSENDVSLVGRKLLVKFTVLSILYFHVKCNIFLKDLRGMTGIFMFVPSINDD